MEVNSMTVKQSKTSKTSKAYTQKELVEKMHVNMPEIQRNIRKLAQIINEFPRDGRCCVYATIIEELARNTEANGHAIVGALFHVAFDLMLKESARVVHISQQFDHLGVAG